jgi:hypothetical protein
LVHLVGVAVPHLASQRPALSPYDALLRAVRREREVLLVHPVYDAVADSSRLRTFMEAHVFAVWDFMSLLKALQRRLTCIDVPWIPPRSRAASRLINEIVLGEESDNIAAGVTMSHFDLYLEAMHETGADTTCIEAFMTTLVGGATPEQALSNASIPPHVRRFVTGTLAVATSGQVEAIAASFLIGREDLVPAMFRRILPVVEGRGDTTFLRLYLARHIEVDEGAHGPLAQKLLCEICGSDAARWSVATQAAREALQARLRLWDGVVQSIASYA